MLYDVARFGCAKPFDERRCWWPVVAECTAWYPGGVGLVKPVEIGRSCPHCVLRFRSNAEVSKFASWSYRQKNGDLGDRSFVLDERRSCHRVVRGATE